MTRVPTPATIGIAIGLTLVGLAATPVAAQVSVTPGWVEPGSDARIAFTVLNERSQSSVERLEITFPADAPVRDGYAPDKEGWDLTITWAPAIRMADNADDKRVVTVVWSAKDEDATIGPGQADAFALVLQDLPTDAERLVLRSVQTYTSGETEAWDVEPTAGEPMPDRPAPVLVLASSVPEAPVTEADPDDAASEAGSEQADATSEGADARDVVPLEAETVSLRSDAEDVAAGADEGTGQARNATLGLALGMALVIGGAIATGRLRREPESPS